MEANLGHWVKGNKFDVKISHEDYLDIIDILQDERLSREGIYRFKSLAEINAVSIPTFALLSLPFGYGLARFFSGKSLILFLEQVEVHLVTDFCLQQ